MLFRNTAVSGALALICTASFVAASFYSAPAFARTPAPAGAYVYIISPDNGETLSSPVTVKFGLSGMGVAPAGVDKPQTGHHHLLIDTGLPALDTPIPADANHKHFGGGQTETVIALPPRQAHAAVDYGRYDSHSPRATGQFQNNHYYREIVGRPATRCCDELSSDIRVGRDKRSALRRLGADGTGIGRSQVGLAKRNPTRARQSCHSSSTCAVGLRRRANEQG